MQSNAAPVQMASTAPATQALGVLAIEFTASGAPPRPALPQAQAGELAACVARDLANLVPAVRSLDLLLAAAHFDPAEALRPGWPLHRRLRELGAAAPGASGAGRVIAFGADAQGIVPLPLAADDTLQGGALRVLPFALHGDPATLEDAGAALEACLLDTGMAQAETALLAQEAFVARIEHARYLTLHDLAAMTALQYRNQGLDGLWSVVEAALLRPEAEFTVDAPPEPLLRHADGEVRIALLSPDAWRRRHDPRGEAEGERLEQLHALFQARQRQYAAVLRAHGIEATFAHCRDPAEL